MSNSWGLVEVSAIVPDVVVDLRYASAGHPFGDPMYPVNRAFLVRGTVEKLAHAQALLKPAGMRLKVWDAYRPLSVQALMWDRFPNPDYVAPPARGSRHNRGAAVDVTLVDTNGVEAPMPTDFDDFTAAARSDAPCEDATAASNRDALRIAMLAAGFEGIGEEWWHFDDSGWRDCPLCDVSLQELAGQEDATKT